VVAAIFTDKYIVNTETNGHFLVICRC